MKSIFGTMKLLLLLFAATAAFMLSAASVVGSVKFEQKGSGPVAEELLRHNVRLRPGAAYTRELLDEDIRSLYRTGNFADVQAVTDYPDRSRVNVTFHLRLKERISKIEIKGNKKFSKGDLGKLITIPEGGLLNSVELRKSAAALRKFYHDRGYRDATVTPLFVPQGNDTAVVFQIDEKLRLKVGEVTFEGVKLFSHYELRHSIANAFSYMNYVPFVNDYLNFGLFDRHELTKDRARLREKYHDKGYLDFKIVDIVQTPDPKDPEYVNLHFKVEEGKPYTVEKITFSGNNIYNEKVLAPYVKLKSKTPFSLAAESATVNGITRLYETIGHAEIRCRAIRLVVLCIQSRGRLTNSQFHNLFLLNILYRYVILLLCQPGTRACLHIPRCR